MMLKFEIKLRGIKYIINFWPYKLEIVTFNALIRPWLIALQTGNWTDECDQSLLKFRKLVGRINYIRNYRPKC